MPNKKQGISVPFGGGLDLISTSFDLLQQPGVATHLVNYESAPEGGYRRVDGHRKFSRSHVISITVTDGGSGYTSSPSVIVRNSVGESIGLLTTTIVSNGAVTAINVHYPGTIQDSDKLEVAPTVDIQHPTGTGATATANILEPQRATESGVLGLHAHKSGGFSMQALNTYWSRNGHDWVQLNYNLGTCSSGTHSTQKSCEADNHTWTPGWGTIKDYEDATSTSLVQTSSLGRYQFTEMTTADVDNPIIIATNGKDPISYIETRTSEISVTALVTGGTYVISSELMSNTATAAMFVTAGATYGTPGEVFIYNGTTAFPFGSTGAVLQQEFKYYQALWNAYGISVTPTADYADIPKPQWCETHNDHLVVTGWDALADAVYISNLYDPTSFTGANSSQYGLSSVVSGIKTFRKDLYIFSVDSISKLVGINESVPALVDVTKNIGCVSGWTIQEIGGDLLFLGPDGLRNVAATERIDDIELSSVSQKVAPIIDDIVNNLDTYRLTSTVVRSKNQYRLFYFDPGVDKRYQKGLLGTFKISPQGAPTWEWSETKGIEVFGYTSIYDADNVERLYHGDADGNIYSHNVGSSFDGDNIRAEYTTPDIDYGDIGLRKTLHNLKLNLHTAGDTSMSVTVRYDFYNPTRPQPLPVYAETDFASFLGEDEYGTANFGGRVKPVLPVDLNGSGFSNNFIIVSDNTLPSHSLQGIYVEFVVGGRK